MLDGTAGLWCSNAGHSRDPIVAAIQRQAEQLDYAPTFQFGHPLAFELASRIAALAPSGLDRVFFCNSGSEAVDTALKIALAYHHVRGDGARTRLIGRERGYHGTGFGGISVGGIVNNRKFFGALLGGVDHLPATYSREHQAFSKGEPQWGAHFADDLERIVALHDAATIAAVIVEPMAGSTGVLPPPKGYLERLRAICDRAWHFADLRRSDHRLWPARLRVCRRALRCDARPDRVRQGRHLGQRADGRRDRARQGVYDAFMRGPEQDIELFHGYTSGTIRSLAPLDWPRWISTATKVCLSAHARAQAAVCRRRNGAQRTARRARHPHSGPDGRDRSRSAPQRAPGARAAEAMNRAFHDEGLMIRITGDTIALCPPLIVREAQIGEIFVKVAKVIRATE